MLNGGSVAGVDAPSEHLAVLGSPIDHSKSPRIHDAAYRLLGLAWSFDRFRVEAHELEEFLEQRRDSFRGFAVTMPLKVEAHRLSAILDPVARETGVVNTLLRLDSEAQPWAGFNTDVGGLTSALSRAQLSAANTLILGAGATAVSAILAAKSLGAERITVCARREVAARVLAERFGVQAVSFDELSAADSAAHTLAISTLPASAGAHVTLAPALFEIPLLDVVYDPWPSPLAARWEAAGGLAVSGLSMLIEQALLQIRIFYGGDPGFPLEQEETLRAAMFAAARGMGD